MKTFPVLLGVFFLSVFSTAHVSAQKPITAGDVAGLIDEKPTEDSRNLLRQALGDSRPLVRGVAARVIGLGSHQDFYPVLLEALRREDDVFAAGEQVRASLFLRGREAVAAARTAAERLGSVPLLILAECLVIVEGMVSATGCVNQATVIRSVHLPWTFRRCRRCRSSASRRR